MNQLRERPSLPVGREVAARGRLPARRPARGGARARDGRTARRSSRTASSASPTAPTCATSAMVLEAVVLLGLAEHVGPLAKSLSESLSKKEWLEHARDRLRAARAVEGGARPEGRLETAFSFEWNGAAATARERRRRRSWSGGSRSARATAPKLVGAQHGQRRRSTRGSSSRACRPVGRETSASSGLVARRRST